eukprot:CAMPEP_0172390452 /NCGR_PEP_ID=MMETSP1061-20121228/7091_1 /TAXON_ID=37318 /ORGANISM="Pseudo-nitzschia pungens, Strain cf. pungens" /LENGTH=1397 /DNA_ID=CAMNT_0013120835 /DNA_START=294 /DNA_END=4487 /DNA_ORIENTATION=-
MEVLTDVNAWFDQIAATVARQNNKGYRVSPKDVVFTGDRAPNYRTEVLSYGITECPETYCIKVVGPALGRKVKGKIVTNETTSLLYAFSSRDAWLDFYGFLAGTMVSYYKDNIFKTNAFMKCGCESFCHDNDLKLNSQATCYVEEQCGTKTFQIAYSKEYPSEKRVSWEKTGTTKVMGWFNECADAMFGCNLSSDSKPLSSFAGGSYLPPATYFSTSIKTFSFGGDVLRGFPEGTSSPQIIWSCPATDKLSALKTFGDNFLSTGLWRNSDSTSSLPKLPCDDKPDPPTYPPPQTRTGPACDQLKHKGFCFELPSGTCYIKEATENCSAVDFVFKNSTSSFVTGDVAEWYKYCVSEGTSCPYWKEYSNGELTYKGMPTSVASYMEYSKTWLTVVFNRVTEKKESTLKGSDVYKCGDWVNAYIAQNFTNAAGGYYKDFENSYGDVFETGVGKCTPNPTLKPTPQPTNLPSMSPTYCSESYLDSSSLNINLVIDLSLSTYEKTFSSTVDIGDVNGDGKGNTILDAQIVAIEDLLKSIAASASLTNSNCEIHLTSFHTDATNHGTWPPTDKSGTGINMDLMNYIKQKLRTPKDLYDVYLTNNGYTNFDAALDKSVEYFSTSATPNRMNLMVFLSDGEPNVRGDGDQEGYCADTVNVWFAEDDEPAQVSCADLNIVKGEPHKFCLSNDSECVPKNAYQDCVRGPDACQNKDAVTQYGSELKALDALKVERLAIGVGDESNVQSGSALWMIDNNPAKDLGVLPVQALDLQALSDAVKNLCILNTESPTTSPSASPSVSPTTSPAPSASPSDVPTSQPTDVPTGKPSEGDIYSPPKPTPTKSPTPVPSSSPTVSPTSSPTPAPSTSDPSSSPTSSPSANPSQVPSHAPSSSPTVTPTPLPSSSPTLAPTTSPSAAPSGSFYPSSAPTDSPTKSPAPSAIPTDVPSGSPSSSPTTSPSDSPTTTPSASPSSVPTDTPSSSPTTSPSESPSSSPTTSPSVSPSSAPTESAAPTFFLPDCYDGPKLVAKDSSDAGLCYFDPAMVEVSNMNKTDVSIRVQNVWRKTSLPSDVRVFVHSDGVSSVNGGGDGFDCLDDVGNAVDIQQYDKTAVKCYQEEGGKWLGVVDIVVTDPEIETNSVFHPCHPEKDQLKNSCSWRLIVPCDSEDLCSASPTNTPSVSPSALPSSDPTASPSSAPSTSPTKSPSDSPTSSPSVTHSSEPSSSPTASPTVTHSSVPTSSPSSSSTESSTSTPTSTPTFPPTFDFNENSCPADLILLKKEGVTNFPKDALQIIDQSASKVTIKLHQSYTTSNTTIDSMYYQFQPDNFDRKCLEKKNVPGGDTTSITIQCTKTSQIALLEVWIADSEVLTKDDKAIVPDCCHPTVSKGTPVSKYLLEIKCVSVCDEQSVA